MKKTWFITGASRGFGRIWAEAALQRGDQVAATARNLADVAELSKHFGDSVLPLALDVTDSEQVQHAVQTAYAHFGKLDILVNNAGVSLFAATEEATDDQIRELFDANYLGMVRVLRAALPLMRKQGCGHILGVSSGLGIAALPLIGFYSATKWAVEALHEALAQEVKAFGIKVTVVEPGAYATDFGKSARIADSLEPYAEFRRQVLTHLADVEQGDPNATAKAVLQLVDAENPPLRLGLGTSILPRARYVFRAPGYLGGMAGRLERSHGQTEKENDRVDRAIRHFGSNVMPGRKNSSADSVRFRTFNPDCGRSGLRLSR